MADLVDQAAERELELRSDAMAEFMRRRPAGGGAERCVDCGAVIPAARRRAVPWSERCTECQAADEQRQRRR